MTCDACVRRAEGNDSKEVTFQTWQLVKIVERYTLSASTEKLTIKKLAEVAKRGDVDGVGRVDLAFEVSTSLSFLPL